MKRLIFPILFVCLYACEKPKPEIIYIRGVVTDKITGAPVDSMRVNLESRLSVLFSYYGTKEYFVTGKDGQFNFSFIPDDERIYKITTSKLHYNWTYNVFNKDKAFQVFHVEVTKYE